MKESDEFEYKLNVLINEVLELRKIWDQRRIEAENQIKSLDTKLNVYQSTLKGFWEHFDIEERRKNKQMK